MFPNQKVLPEQGFESHIVPGNQKGLAGMILEADRKVKCVYKSFLFSHVNKTKILLYSHTCGTLNPSQWR